jgi:hypothetical protein
MLCYFADVVVYLLRREGEKNKKRRLTKTPSRHNKRGRRNELASALLSRPSFPSIRCGFPFPFHRSRASLRPESYALRTRPPIPVGRPCCATSACLAHGCQSRVFIGVAVGTLHSVVESTTAGRSPRTAAENAVVTSCGRLARVDATGRAALGSQTELAASSCSRRGLIWTTPSRIACDMPSRVGSLLISTLPPILACLPRCLICSHAAVLPLLLFYFACLLSCLILLARLLVLACSPQHRRVADMALATRCSL